jgi:cell division septum initiation protein DivIVA
MSLTPLELRHVKLGRGMAGYDTKQTDRLLHEVAASFAEVWEERGALREQLAELEGNLVRAREQVDDARAQFDLERRAMRARITELEQEVERYKEMEHALQTTLQAAQDVRAELVAELATTIEGNIASARDETTSLIEEFLAQYRERLFAVLELERPLPTKRQESILEALAFSGQRGEGDGRSAALLGAPRESPNGPLTGR